MLGTHIIENRVMKKKNKIFFVEFVVVMFSGVFDLFSAKALAFLLMDFQRLLHLTAPILFPTFIYLCFVASKESTCGF